MMKKINFIDILVLIAVLIGIAGIFVRFGGQAGQMVSTPATVRYTVAVRSIRKYTVDGLTKMGDIYDAYSKDRIGTIVDVQTKQAIFESAAADGAIVACELPERYDTLVTIETEGKNGLTGYYDEKNYELNVGGSASLNSKWVACYGKIVNVEIKS